MKKQFNPYIVPVKNTSIKNFFQICNTGLDNTCKLESYKQPEVYNAYYCEVKKPGHWHFTECEIPARPPMPKCKLSNY